MRQRFGLASVSALALMLELAFTRLLSAIFFPQAVFIAISVAILGIGFGAALTALLPTLRRMALLSAYCVSTGAAAILAAAVVTLLPNPLSFGLMVLPFVFVGAIITTIFSKNPAQSTSLYAADLGGAGVGVLLAIPLLNAFGALNGLLVLGVLLTLCGFWFRGDGERGVAVPLQISAVAITVVLAISNVVFGWLDIDYLRGGAEKPITQVLENGGTVLDTRWDAFARTDLVSPGDAGPYQIYVDGAAGSIIPPLENNDFLIRDIGFFPFATQQPARVIVIGSGGGLDIWYALRANARQVNAVEVNGASVALLDEYANYHGDLVSAPGVAMIVGEGRNTLLRSGEQYDLIYLAQVITETSTRSGLALSENTIYTVEAFQTYLDHLTRDGQIALKLYDEPTLTRAVSVALAAFRANGLTDAEALQRMMVFIDPSVQPPLPVLIIQNAPLSEEDALSFGAVAQQVGFVPLYLPGLIAQPPLTDVASGVTTFDDVIAEYDGDISPTTDNRPYFFQLQRGLPTNLRALVGGAFVALTVLLVTAWLYRGRVSQPALGLGPLYFIMLGVGFICIEIAVIQITGLFLGHPTVAIAVTIAAFLVGGGLGSALAGPEMTVAPLRIPFVPIAAILVLTGVWLVVWNTFSAGLIYLPLMGRIGFTVVSLLPLTMMMGLPFPTGLQAIADAGESHIALAWTMNGIASVVGSVMAVVLSVVFGFNSVLILGVVVYALALLIIWRMRAALPPVTG